MTDTLFRDFLVAQAEQTKNELTNADLTTEQVLEKAKAIFKMENRVKRMDNPTTRKPRAPKVAVEA